jgi:hypothetical protein
MSGRPCSLAISVFFVALLLATKQVPDRDVTHDGPSFCQFVCQCPRRDVGLLGDTGQHPIACAIKNAGATPAHLTWLEATSGTIARHQLDDGRWADAEAAPRCSAGHSIIDSSDNPNSEITIERFGHRRWPPAPATMMKHCSSEKGIPPILPNINML